MTRVLDCPTLYIYLYCIIRLWRRWNSCLSVLHCSGWHHGATYLIRCKWSLSTGMQCQSSCSLLTASLHLHFIDMHGNVTTVIQLTEYTVTINWRKLAVLRDCTYSNDISKRKNTLEIQQMKWFVTNIIYLEIKSFGGNFKKILDRRQLKISLENTNPCDYAQGTLAVCYQSQIWCHYMFW